MVRNSITAGVALFCIKPRPSILLVLDKGEKVPQRNGRDFSKPEVWKLPSGGLKSTDVYPKVTAIRELMEETGVRICEAFLSDKLSIDHEKPSWRPGSDVHHDVTYLVIMYDRPKLGTPIDPKIEKARFFPLDQVPIPGSMLAETYVPVSHVRAINELIEKASDKLTELGLDPFNLYLPEEARGDEED
jgi:ADP-ribose pyrophosphatase YjhB (NUDIX family)